MSSVSDDVVGETDTLDTTRTVRAVTNLAMWPTLQKSCAMRAYMCACAPACLHVRLRACMCACAPACLHVRLRAGMPVLMWVSLHAQIVWPCMCACMARIRTGERAWAAKVKRIMSLAISVVGYGHVGGLAISVMGCGHVGDGPTDVAVNCYYKYTVKYVQYT